MTSSVPSATNGIDASSDDPGSPNSVDIELPTSDSGGKPCVLLTHTPPLGVLTYLDPNMVRPPSRPNRDPSSFMSDAYFDLLESIRREGGNVEPIKVLLHVAPLAGDETYMETIFGERRRRACCDAGLPVLAVVVEKLNGRDAIVEQIAENSARDDFSPFELGRICLAALRSFSGSQKEMCAHMGKNEGDVSKAMSLARLPSEVIHAFESPADLQYRHAKPLRDALAMNSQAVIAEALAVAQGPSPRSAAMVLGRLIRSAVASSVGQIGPSNSSASRPLRVNRRVVGQITSDADGVTTAEIRRPLDKDALEAVASAIEAILNASAAARRHPPRQ